MRVQLVVPPIRSREVARSQRSGIWESEETLQPLNFGNRSFKVHAGLSIGASVLTRWVPQLSVLFFLQRLHRSGDALAYVPICFVHVEDHRLERLCLTTFVVAHDHCSVLVCHVARCRGYDAVIRFPRVLDVGSTRELLLSR